MALATRPQPKRPSAIERYAAAAKAAGMPRDQLRNFVQAGIVLQPRQLMASAAARACDATDGPTEILYGGARGGGKSHWMLAQMAADDCQRYPGLKCLYLRKVGKAIKESFEDLRHKLLRGLPHDYKRQEGVVVFPNGSRIVIGHFKDERDIDAYLGLEYDLIGTEEATTLSTAKIKAIATTRRTSKPDWRPRSYFTTNPGGVSHGHFKATFIEPYRRGMQTKTRFVPATVDDNKFLNAEYVETLDTLTGWQKRAWRLGDWDIAAGQFFVTWRDSVHVIAPLEIPKDWRVWCALDYGFTHWTMCYLFAQSGDGVIYVVDEHGARGWLVERHAAAITAMLARHGIGLHRLAWFVAGSDVFAKKQDGGTIAADYKRHGIQLTAANSDRINGAAEVLNRLGDVDATDMQGQPKPIAPSLFVMSRCRRLIECLPALQHDPHRPEDVLKWDADDDGAGGDDPYDAMRYGVMAAAKPVQREIRSYQG